MEVSRTEVGCHFPLQGIFLIQKSNPGLPLCRRTLYHLCHQGVLSILVDPLHTLKKNFYSPVVGCNVLHMLLAFILLGLGVLWAFFVCGLVSNINLEEILCHYCFCSFFSPPPGIPIVICDTFVLHSSWLFCSCFFFPSLFSFSCFWKFLLTYPEA